MPTNPPDLDDAIIAAVALSKGTSVPGGTIARRTEIPVDVLTEGLARLVDAGRLELDGDGYFIPEQADGPGDFPTREQHERISDLAITAAPEPVKVEVDAEARTVRCTVGSLGRVHVFDENGDDVTGKHEPPMIVRVELPLDCAMRLLGAEVVAEAALAGRRAWPEQRTMIEAMLAHKLGDSLVDAIRAVLDSDRVGA